MIHLPNGLERYSMSVRIVKLSVLGLISFLIVFGLLVNLNIEIDYLRCWHSVDNYGKDRLQADKVSILRELWLRRTIPPSVRGLCYANDAYICNLADAVSVSAGLVATIWYWEIVISLISALVIVIFARRRVSYTKR